MVEVFTPFLMILLTWNDRDPDASMTILQRTYIDEATCQKAGKERLLLIEEDRKSRIKKFKVEQVKTESAKFFCIPQSPNIIKYRPLVTED
ncbi:MAG: hypothetical protein Pars2KO_17890 [Parasphingorhabdus sp.]